MKERISYTEIGQVPKVEELYLSLQIPISNAMANWKKREDFQSFWITYLDGETKKLIMEQHWDALGNILALLIYGLVFFPTFKGFIDSTIICIFWVVWKDKESPGPPLLDDIFHTIHFHHEKRSGSLLCCLPLI